MRGKARPFWRRRQQLATTPAGGAFWRETMSATQLTRPIELPRNPQSPGATSISPNRCLGRTEFGASRGIREIWRYRAPGEEIGSAGVLLLELSALDYAEFDEEFQGGEPALLSYIDATYTGGRARRKAAPAPRTRMAERGVTTSDLERQGGKRHSSTTRPPVLSRRPTAPTRPAFSNRYICIII